MGLPIHMGRPPRLTGAVSSGSAARTGARPVSAQPEASARPKTAAVSTNRVVRTIAIASPPISNHDRAEAAFGGHLDRAPLRCVDRAPARAEELHADAA